MKKVLLFLLAALILPWQVAHGVGVGAQQAPPLTITPSIVKAGNQITISAPNGFSFGGTNPMVKITIGTNPTVTYYVAPNSGGGFTSTYSVPASTANGNYTVMATGINGTTGYASGTFQVASPTLTISPATTTAGGTVTVSGQALPPTSMVQLLVTFQRINNGGPEAVAFNGTVNSSGQLQNTPLAVPSDVANGQYTVTATQNGATVAIQTLTVNAATSAITLSPSSTSASGSFQTITVRGTGFGPNEAVTVSYSVTLTTNVQQPEQATATTDQGGNFSLNTLYVPPGASPGTYTVTAKGQTSGRTATATLTLSGTATLTLSQASATPGTVVTVTGTHFAANTAVTVSAQLRLSDGTMADLQANATTDASGTFSAPLPLPGNAVSGSVTVSATQNNGTFTGTTTLTVTPLQAGITASPSPVAPSGTVTITGNGFLGGGGNVVQITAQVGTGTSTVSVATVGLPDASGHFTTTLVLPASATSGTAQVTAFQQASNTTASTTFSIQTATATTVPTSTPTPTAIPTSTPTATPTPNPGAGGLRFKYLRVRLHSAHLGDTNRLDVQAVQRVRLSIWIHINFPSGQHYDFYTNTDKSGHYSKGFVVPTGALSKYANRVFVHAQLWRGKRTTKTWTSFAITR